MEKTVQALAAAELPRRRKGIERNKLEELFSVIEFVDGRRLDRLSASCTNTA
ncbi:MAG: hypothetical protein ACR2NN_24770 [Bryobacteraceae bacterium]